MKIFAFGSSIISSYWNGAATYYRGVYKYLAARGHQITFAEPDAYGRQQHIDNGDFSFVESVVYKPGVDIDAMLQQTAGADLVVKHSGIGVDDELLEARISSLDSRQISVFWDVDAPATLGRVEANPVDPFRRAVPAFDAILTYGGGPAVEQGYRALGARSYASIYNGLDPETHFPVEPDAALACDLAFVGNRLPDREGRVDELFFRAASIAGEKTFLLAGEGWSDKQMPPNVRWIGHLPTAEHNRVNCSASMVININRSSMAQSGFSPPTRVFEVAGAGACLLCDDWPGIDDCFEPGSELLVVRNAEDVVDALRATDKSRRKQIREAFRSRALRDHTYAQRALLAERAFAACLEHKNNAVLTKSSA